MRSYELLDFHGGVTLLAGVFGPGHDIFRMTKIVLPGSRITGPDSSEAMIIAAQAKPLAATLPVDFGQGDIKAPLFDQSFQRCLIDRTLQHIEHPPKAVTELVRVLKSGGLLLDDDNNSDTFSIKSGYALSQHFLIP